MILTALLLWACGDADSPGSGPVTMYEDSTSMTTGDTAPTGTPNGNPAWCSGSDPVYPTEFDVVGDGWGWLNGACFIDPEWPRQPCPEVHLGPPPKAGGDVCESRANCPADSDTDHWFCGSGACRRLEDEWLTLCVNEAWVAGQRWEQGGRNLVQPIPTFAGLIYYDGAIDEETAADPTYGDGYTALYYQPAVTIPFTEGCRSTVRYCDLIPPTFFPQNVDIQLGLSWVVWEDDTDNGGCRTADQHISLGSTPRITLTELATRVNQGCIGLGKREQGYDLFSDLCVGSAGARVSLWYP